MKRQLHTPAGMIWEDYEPEETDLEKLEKRVAALEKKEVAPVE